MIAFMSTVMIKIAMLVFIINPVPTLRGPMAFNVLAIVAVLRDAEPGVISVKVLIAKLVIRQTRHVHERVGREVVGRIRISAIGEVSSSIVIVL